MTQTIDASTRASLLALALILLAVPMAALGEDKAEDPSDFPGPSHFLQAAYQYGAVLQTNDFLKGDNATGQPIDRFQSLRFEFGWQVDGSKDWHHIYDMPTYGLGLYGATYPGAENEIGDPTSFYGFYNWPLHRTDRWRINFEIKFGFTNNWKPYDPVNNPNNTAFGLARSVHIEAGASAEFRLAKRWSAIAGFTFTHFSNGGTQLPNHGLNQVAPILYAKYDIDTPLTPPPVRHIPFEDKGWDLLVTGSGGKRNLNLEFEDAEDREEYLNRSYFIGNLTMNVARKFSHKFRYTFGLDFCYDQTVGDLERIDGINKGYNADPKSSDYLELAAIAGFEANVHRTDFLIHLGYKLFYKDVPGRLPEFYQRLGVRQYVWQNMYLGLNVRFHELGSADNLEWNIGYKMDM